MELPASDASRSLPDPSLRLKNGSGQDDSLGIRDRLDEEPRAKIKKPEPNLVPALVLAGCPDKIVQCRTLIHRHNNSEA